MRAPDLTAPRHRLKCKGSTDDDFIKMFRAKYPQYKHYKDDIIRKVVKKHNELLYKEVINNRDGIELQTGLGIIFVGSVPQSKKKPPKAYQKSIKLGMPVYYKNWDTDGHVAKIFYSNYACKYKFELRRLWGFDGSRKFTRSVAVIYPKQWKMYVAMDNLKHVWKLFIGRINSDRFDRKQTKSLETYNEFEQ